LSYAGVGSLPSIGISNISAVRAIGKIGSSVVSSARDRRKVGAFVIEDIRGSAYGKDNAMRAEPDWVGVIG